MPGINSLWGGVSGRSVQKSSRKMPSAGDQGCQARGKMNIIIIITLFLAMALVLRRLKKYKKMIHLLEEMIEIDRGYIQHLKKIINRQSEPKGEQTNETIRH